MISYLGSTNPKKLAFGSLVYRNKARLRQDTCAILTFSHPPTATLRFVPFSTLS